MMCSLVALAQTMSAEIRLLRDQLGVPDSVPITMAESDDLLKSGALKVFIAAGFDIDVRKRTIDRINDWNSKDAINTALSPWSRISRKLM